MIQEAARWLSGLLGPGPATFLISLLPGVEPRYGLVLGVAVFGLGLWEALAYSSAAAFTLSLLLPGLVEHGFEILEGLARRYRRLAPLQGLLERLAQSSARRARGSIEKYSVLGLIVFVAVPLPLTGIYTGALAAYMLGLRGRTVNLALLAGGLASILFTGAAAGLLTVW